jgi:hypothetical protein
VEKPRVCEIVTQLGLEGCERVRVAFRFKDGLLVKRSVQLGVVVKVGRSGVKMPNNRARLPCFIS